MGLKDHHAAAEGPVVVAQRPSFTRHQSAKLGSGGNDKTKVSEKKRRNVSASAAGRRNREQEKQEGIITGGGRVSRY